MSEMNKSHEAWNVDPVPTPEPTKCPVTPFLLSPRGEPMAMTDAEVGQLLSQLAATQAALVKAEADARALQGALGKSMEAEEFQCKRWAKAEAEVERLRAVVDGDLEARLVVERRAEQAEKELVDVKMDRGLRMLQLGWIGKALGMTGDNWGVPEMLTRARQLAAEAAKATA